MLEFFVTNQLALINSILLFACFAVFHSLCAQIWFKDWLKRVTSDFFVEHFWRIIYVYVSLKLYFGIAAPYLFYNIENVVLYQPGELGTEILRYIAFIGGYGFVLVLIELDFLYYIGLKQMTRGILIKLGIRKDTDDPVKYTLKTKYFYRLMRHPLYFFLLLMLAPTATTAAGLISILLIIAYLAIGLPIEEKKLVQQFGDDYIQYRKITPAIIPFAKINWWRSLRNA